MSDTPIFTQLLIEYRRAGRSLPWGHSFKTEDTIGILEETSRGIPSAFDINVRFDREGNPIDYEKFQGCLRKKSPNQARILVMKNRSEI